MKWKSKDRELVGQTRMFEIFSLIPKYCEDDFQYHWLEKIVLCQSYYWGALSNKLRSIDSFFTTSSYEYKNYKYMIKRNGSYLTEQLKEDSYKSRRITIIR